MTKISLEGIPHALQRWAPLRLKGLIDTITIILIVMIITLAVIIVTMQLIIVITALVLLIMQIITIINTILYLSSACRDGACTPKDRRRSRPA